MKLSFFILMFVLYSCGSFQAERQNSDQSDEKALKVTDNWVDKDTEMVIKDTLNQMKSHPGFQKYLMQHRSGDNEKPAIFIAELQNRTAEAYFPIDDVNNEFLNILSREDEFVLVDAQAREKLLNEIKYQNDGMVDPASMKTIGKQTGADALMFGSVQMKPEVRDGKTVKQYSIDFRLTNLEKGTEILRTRAKIFKYSEKKTFGF